MKKISILTFSLGDNYGAALQAYSLGEVLRRKGNKVTYIYLTWSTWRYKILSMVTPIHYKFNRFRSKYLRYFSKKCKSFADLRALTDNPDDLYIVGSDQVWNPDITKDKSLFYFFNFLPNNIKRASYAASFGVSEWKYAEQTDTIRDLLKKFSVVSVREESGIKICKETFDIPDVSKVLDPTLLLGDFKSLIKPTKHRGKIISFLFHPSRDSYNLLEQLNNKMKKDVLIMDLPRMRFDLRQFKYGVSMFNSPEDWVSNISSAAFIVTDSYHCLVFSLIFRRQFVFIATNTSLLGRITTLLEPLGLSNRIYDSPECVFKNSIWQQEINYDYVHSRLDQMRSSSMSVLDKILEI